MAYKYLNDNGLKAYTKKVKGALKDLHTPIAISTENTTESMAQNVRNIADFIAKAKAAGIADVNGMSVTCLIDNDYSGVGYFYMVEGTFASILGVKSIDDLSEHYVFNLDSSGNYFENLVLTATSSNVVTSDMLTQGARKPIILTPSTTEVDEETYQKLLSNNVDVMFKTSDGNPNLCTLTYKYDDGDTWSFTFTCFSREGDPLSETYFYGYDVRITKIGNPHPCEVIDNSTESQFSQILLNEGFTNRSFLSPVLQEIDLTGTDAERKDKLAKFEIYWKDLTGASDMKGARFVGNYEGELLIMAYSFANDEYEGICYGSIEQMVYRYTLELGGTLHITPLFSHLEPVEIFTDNSAESKKKNIDNLNAYKSNLAQLGIDISGSFQVPIYRKSNSGVEESGFLIYSNLPHVYKPYSGLFLTVDETSFSIFGISSTGEFIEQTYYATLEDVQQANTLAQALKNLHTPIAISTENTTESMAQNVRNIADFIAKAKAAGITDVNGMAVSCIIDDGYSGVGYLYGDTNTNICGIISYDDTSNPYTFAVNSAGEYIENEVLTATATNLVSSGMLTRGARRPIILTPSTTEVDEGTYQKLLSDNVDVVFNDGMDNLCTLAGKEDIGSSWKFYFTVLSGNTDIPENIYLSAYEVKIVKNGVHKCTIGTNIEWMSIDEILTKGGYLKQSILTPVSLTTTTSTNKTQLDLFLSKVPNAQVMHITYKDVYAGTLHKINGSWYGVLVGESNTLAGQLSIKLQADGTIVEGTA